MKNTKFYLLFCLLWMSSATLFAGATATEIPLRVVTGNGMFKPMDGPDQSSDDPPRPNQFHAFIQGQVLSFRIANANSNHVMVHNPSGVKILDVQFVGDAAFRLPTYGLHIVEIQNGNLRLQGEFTRSVEKNRSSNPTQPVDPDEPPSMPIYSIRINDTTDCYVIDVEFPQFEIEEVVFPNELASTAQIFNRVIYQNAYRYFDYGMVNGQPEMPFLSLNLQIPGGAVIDTAIEMIEYYNDIELTYPYAPAQIVSENDDNPILQYDDDYYDGITFNEWGVPVLFSQPYSMTGTKGVNVQFRPALFFPDGNILRPISRIRFTICVSEGEALSHMYATTLATPSLNDMVNFYDTYRAIDTIVHPDYKGNFLILVTEDYLDEAESYADHKNDLGFNAWVEPLASNMLDSAFIRHLIKTWYDYEECRPKFVLLIGSDIPYSYGVMNDSTNPPTDMYYACLDYFSNDSIVQNKEDITPDVYVGRWPVHNGGELDFIMEKSREYDWITPNKRMVLASGIDTRDEAHEDVFVNVIDSIQALVRDFVPSMTVINYTGRNGFDSQYLNDEFEHHDNLIFVYRGHGGENSLGAPFDDITSSTLPNNLPYFSFAFGCKMNYPEGLGNAWVNTGDRSCTFYGATVTTYSTLNTNLQLNMFRGLKGNRNISIGEFVYNGVRRASKSMSGWWYLLNYKRASVCAYVLNGDPSLYIFGTRLFNNALQHSPSNAEDLQNVEHEMDILSYALYTISGILVYSQVGNVDNLTANIDALDLQDGIYILSTQTRDNVISSQKIIVQH